ncbi:bifunctional adenosylcobinamide kinase/adenosylcobinamide-phosphate guanylyltransferase [Kineosporia sp. NBRC 101731]|uniref:bifunctional adenosylcobinamide kinase/adenosylcobinamide-phosphate guanylyltransferase n=1 Tax=Kineosporia sp. NBRC 101731 TaxID=3032199 RepID=UPI0024A4B810|nr:bifunctional adenosylcobinamide kinase/adenosylcobinamide-phosphate guanylyltransferase [Kineosporia sp. NBRC 101731]GLY32814.1 hypothetical protein Kisp02_61790 [Kineosporia sp. NBRC 101731]
MRLTLTGTGPAEGFPVPDCPCAVCARARRDGVTAEPARLVSSSGWEISVDGVVTVTGAHPAGGMIDTGLEEEDFPAAVPAVNSPDSPTGSGPQPVASPRHPVPRHPVSTLHELEPGRVLTLDGATPGTRFEALGEGVVLIRAADLTVVWAPQAGAIGDLTIDALAALSTGSPPTPPPADDLPADPRPTGPLSSDPLSAADLLPAADLLSADPQATGSLPTGPRSVNRPPDALILGPEPESSAPSGEMPSLGCARTIARLRARGVIGEHTRCLLVGFGHRETHPARLQACLPAWGAELAVAGTAPGLPHPQSSPLPRLGRVLVLGGSGSGKSAFAEQLLSAAPEVVYLATGPKPVRSGEETPSTGDGSSPTEHPEDDEWASRVRRHQERRPDWWSTLETIDVAGPLTGDGRAILLDSVGTWLSGVLDRCGAWDDRPGWKEQLDAETETLLRAWRERSGPLVAVSDEVGWSIVPSTESGRLFRDQLGRLNGKLAEASEDVHVIVAGRLLRAEA